MYSPQLAPLFSSARSPIPYSSSAANAAATTPTPIPTRPAPLVPLGVGLALGLGVPVATGTVAFPLGVAPPVAMDTSVETVVEAEADAELPEAVQRMEPSCTGLVAMRAGDAAVNFAEPGSLPWASLKAWQVTAERSTPDAETILRPQTEGRSGVGQHVRNWRGRWRAGFVPLTTRLPTSISKLSSCVVLPMQGVSWSLTVAAEAAEMRRAAVRAKVFIVVDGLRLRVNLQLRVEGFKMLDQARTAGKS